MSIGVLRGTAVALSSAVVISVSPLAAEPVALGSYNAAIGETSISGISSGAFMAVQFATAWSSVIKGVGVIAGGPFWCAKADADDFINGYMLPVLTATGSCMTGPPTDLGFFVAKADAKAASGDIDSLQNLSRQKIYIFHGYNDAVVAKSVTDAAADFYRHYLGIPTMATCTTRLPSVPDIRWSFCKSRTSAASTTAKTTPSPILTSAAMTRLESFCSIFTVR
jgi:poly(3-hydroxybutyrate) depolymerase